jgi:hypothetical protein
VASIKPNSKQEYEENKVILLATLPQIKKPQEPHASYLILQTLPLGARKQGNYQVEVSLANLPAGLHHYTLKVNGERTDTKKMAVQ